MQHHHPLNLVAHWNKAGRRFFIRVPHRVAVRDRSVGTAGVAGVECFVL